MNGNMQLPRTTTVKDDQMRKTYIRRSQHFAIKAQVLVSTYDRTTYYSSRKRSVMSSSNSRLRTLLLMSVKMLAAGSRIIAVVVTKFENTCAHTMYVRTVGYTAVLSANQG